MQVRPFQTHTAAPPCPSRARPPTPHAATGLARLEFALTVTVVALIVAFALDHISQLQGPARNAQADTLAAQARSTAALAEARGAAAPVPCPITPAQAAPSGTLPPAEPPLSCP